MSQQERIADLEAEFHALTILINSGNIDVNALDMRRLQLYEEIRVLKRLQIQDQSDMCTTEDDDDDDEEEHAVVD